LDFGKEWFYLNDSFLKKVCRYYPHFIEKVLEPNMIPSLGPTNVLNLIVGENERFDYNVFFIGVEDSDLQNINGRAISWLLNVETIAAMGPDNVQVILELHAKSFKKGFKESDSYLRMTSMICSEPFYFFDDYFKYFEFTNLYNVLLSSDVVSALGADRAYNFLMDNLIVQESDYQPTKRYEIFENKYTYTFFDWSRKNDDFSPIRKFLSEETRNVLGDENIVGFFVRYPRFIVDPDVARCLAPIILELIRDRTLQSFGHTQEWNRYKDLGLTSHWRVQKTPFDRPVFLTFDVDKITYSIPINEGVFNNELRKWVDAGCNISPKLIFTCLDPLVTFYGGKNKQVWTKKLIENRPENFGQHIEGYGQKMAG
jgi:hypothetical protein